MKNSKGLKCCGGIHAHKIERPISQEVAQELLEACKKALVYIHADFPIKKQLEDLIAKAEART